MKSRTTARRVRDETGAKRTRHTRVAGRPAAALTSFKRVIAARFRKVERRMEDLRDELRASEITLAAAQLRALNERQAHDGLTRLHADLTTLREMGIVDEKGRRVQNELPAEMLEGSYDA